VSIRDVIDAFERWRTGGEPLVLVTVAHTEGSTYSKAGHRILITGGGAYQGLVSGGCLENDLVTHAREVLASHQPRLLTYDLRGEHEEIWGLGIGCNGLFRLLLQPVTPADDFAPFAAMAGVIAGDAAGATATVIESAGDAPPPGATLVVGPGGAHRGRLAGAWAALLEAAARASVGAAQARLTTGRVGAAEAQILCAPLRPLPRLLVLGAGPDAAPLVHFARRLGWRVTVADHRPGHLARGDFTAADECVHVDPGALAVRLPLDRYAAAVIMSHHLASDRAYLRSLAGQGPAYVGLLGPAARGHRLLDDLGATAAALRGRLRSPVGLSIGADSPESIALAILAEIHAALDPAPRSGTQPHA
jgi:xanthine/CO dehydrogenase XdhC/CoxF family maturation factor